MRDEADRLVAAAIAAISYAARGFGSSSRPGPAVATGSPECCVCPVCRAIAALRDPAPEFADRLASGVSDLAAGVSSLLRTLQRSGERDAAPEQPGAGEGDEFWESLRRKAADAAKAAARAASTVDPNTRVSTMDDDPWRAATAEPATPRKAVVKVEPAGSGGRSSEPAGSGGRSSEPAGSGGRSSEPAGSGGRGKAVARKAPAPAVPAQPTVRAVARKAVAPKAVARKVVAKKAVAKKAAPRGATDSAGETRA